MHRGTIVRFSSPARDARRCSRSAGNVVYHFFGGGDTEAHFKYFLFVFKAPLCFLRLSKVCDDYVFGTQILLFIKACFNYFFYFFFFLINESNVM